VSFALKKRENQKKNPLRNEQGGSEGGFSRGKKVWGLGEKPEELDREIE